MKTLKVFFSVTLFALLLCACNSDSESYDALGIYPLVDGYDVVYADQKSDTITINSTRKWEAATIGGWLSIPEDYLHPTMQISGFYYDNIPVIFDENLSDTIRTGMVKITSNDKSVYHPYMQVPWMNVTYPSATYTKVDGTVTGASFSEVLASIDTLVTVKYTGYSYTQLSSSEDWITVDESVTYDPGFHQLSFMCTPNPTSTNRAAIIRLKNGSGIETDIKVTQTGAVE